MTMHAIMHIQYATGMIEQRLAIGCQHHPMRRPVQQPSLRQGLQPLDLLTDRGLAQPQSSRGSGETASVSDRHKGAQQARPNVLDIYHDIA